MDSRSRSRRSTGDSLQAISYQYAGRLRGDGNGNRERPNYDERHSAEEEEEEEEQEEDSSEPEEESEKELHEEPRRRSSRYNNRNDASHATAASSSQRDRASSRRRSSSDDVSGTARLEIAGTSTSSIGARRSQRLSEPPVEEEEEEEEELDLEALPRRRSSRFKGTDSQLNDETDKRNGQDNKSNDDETDENGSENDDDREDAMITRTRSRARQRSDTLRSSGSDAGGGRRPGNIGNTSDGAGAGVTVPSRRSSESEWENAVNEEMGLFQAVEGVRLTRQKKHDILATLQPNADVGAAAGHSLRRRRSNSEDIDHIEGEVDTRGRTRRSSTSARSNERNNSDDHGNRRRSSRLEHQKLVAEESDSDNNSSESSEGESSENQQAKRYSLRDRQQIARLEPLNIKNLGGDGAGYKRTRSNSSGVGGHYHQHNLREHHGSSSTRPNYSDSARVYLGGSSRDNNVYSFKKRSSAASSSGHHRHHYNDNNNSRAGGKYPSSSSGRRHFDSSSESDPSRSGSPRRLPSPGIRGHNNNNNNDDSEFQYYEALRLQRERDSIQPINDAVATGMGGSTRDQVSARDVLRADAAPLAVDSSIGFSSVGGLDSHIHSLKEMVVLPLLYPEVFERFDTQPPRGVLFVGPPGTGKTLTARALANSLTAGKKPGDRKVSFFMRKGADCLSKWVGEGERQLRLLFEQAKKFQPSIIFFDEIDGLAPVRSVKQDQIHASIVSTLLALMDGLDSRGQVVVIGATNRPDAIDPALRRPGRFDRELLFSLPDATARRAILSIHTKTWQPPLEPQLSSWIVERTVGFCGADMKALCAEASLIALKRVYPQIYSSSVKLQIDPLSIRLSIGDFAAALAKVVPSSQRSTNATAKPLDAVMQPLLGDGLQVVSAMLSRCFPAINKHSSSNGRNQSLPSTIDSLDPLLAANNLLLSWIGKNGQRNDAWVASLADAQYSSVTTSMAASVAHNSTCSSSTSSLTNLPTFWESHRTSMLPRLMIAGRENMGQTELAAAALHLLEAFPHFSIDYASLVSDVFAQSPEQALTNRINEACKAAPSVVYVPHLFSWWQSASESLRLTLLAVLESLPSSLPVLWVTTLAVKDQQFQEEEQVTGDDGMGNVLYNLHRSTASTYFRRVVDMLAGIPVTATGLQQQWLPYVQQGAGVFMAAAPTASHRENVFQALFAHFQALPRQRYNAIRQLWITQTQTLKPCDTDTSAVEIGSLSNDLSHDDSKRGRTNNTSLQDVLMGSKMFDPHEQQCHRDLRTFFRATLAELQKDRKTQVLFRPVDPELVPDYYDVIQNPMDLEIVRLKVDEGKYVTFGQFQRDLHQIVFNAKSYNPMHSKDQRGRAIVHAANALIDMVDSHAYHFKGELGFDVFARCDDIAARHKIVLMSPMPKATDPINEDNLQYYADILELHRQLNGGTIAANSSNTSARIQRTTSTSSTSANTLNSKGQANGVAKRKIRDGALLESDNDSTGDRLENLRQTRRSRNSGDLAFISLDDIVKPRKKKVVLVVDDDDEIAVSLNSQTAGTQSLAEEMPVPDTAAVTGEEAPVLPEASSTAKTLPKETAGRDNDGYEDMKDDEGEPNDKIIDDADNEGAEFSWPADIIAVPECQSSGFTAVNIALNSSASLESDSRLDTSSTTVSFQPTDSSEVTVTAESGASTIADNFLLNSNTDANVVVAITANEGEVVSATILQPEIDFSAVDVDTLPIMSLLKIAVQQADDLKTSGQLDLYVNRMVRCSEGWNIKAILEAVTKFNRIYQDYHDHGSWDMCSQETAAYITFCEQMDI